MTVRKPRRPHGDGSVFYDESRQRWVAVVELDAGPDGRRRRAKVSGATKQEAATKLRELRKQVDDGHDVTQRGMTVEQLLTTWITDVAPRKQSPTSLRTNRSLVNRRLIPALGSLKVSALRPEHVEQLLNEAAASGSARSSLSRMRWVLSSACKWAQARRIVTWNPAALAELPPATETKPARVTRALNEAEARKLLDAATGHRLAAWVSVAVTYGLRPGELASLQWADFDADAGTLTVGSALKWTPDGWQVGSTKTGNVRVLQLAPELVGLLEQHRRQQAAERNEHRGWPSEWAGLMFTTTTGTPVDARTVRPVLDSIAKRAGLGHVTPYSLRHSACSLLCADGVRLELVADVLGHADTQMVSRHYRHLLAPSITAALPTASRLLSAAGAS